MIARFDDRNQKWLQWFGAMFWKVSLIIIVSLIAVPAISQTSKSDAQHIQVDSRRGGA